MNAIFKASRRHLRNLFKHWPQPCFLCDADSPYTLCPSCVPLLPFQGSACTHCAAALAEHLGHICGMCLQSLPQMDYSQALFRYEYPLTHIIRAAKYGRELSLLQQLGELMAQHLDYPRRPDVVVPVPMHKADLRQRGYNQAVELARCVARQHDLPLSLHDCQCVRRKKVQASLHALKDRQRNVRGIFSANSAFADKHVLLIDDVITTGSTVNEVARTLKRAGASSVSVWCCARRNPRQ